MASSHDNVWHADVKRKITAGMDSIRTGGTIPLEEVKAGMAAFKKKARKKRGPQ